MRKSWITLGILCACVAALGVFVWLKPPKQTNPQHAVSAIKPADVRTLRIARKGKVIATLEKRSTEWFITDPFTAPADAFQVSRLLAVLEAQSTSRYAPDDAAKFELGAPQAEITINDQRFAFGAINNVTREQYVLTQNQVYALELRFAAAIPTEATALLRRTLLAPGDTPQRFEFGTFTVAYDEKKWITTPPTGDVSQDDYNRWVAQWREGSALRTEIGTKLADKRTADKEIRIALKDGRTLALGIVQTEPELILRRADLGLQFVFVDTVGAQMIRPPAARK